MSELTAVLELIVTVVELYPDYSVLAALGAAVADGLINEDEEALIRRVVREYNLSFAD